MKKFKIKKEDAGYIAAILAIVIIMFCAVFPRHHAIKQSEHPVKQWVSEFQAGNLEFNHVMDGRFNDYFSKVEFTNIDGTLVTIKSKSLIENLARTYNTMREYMNELGMKVGDDGYGQVYDENFWRVFYEELENVEQKVNTVAVSLYSGEVELGDGKNLDLVAAIFGMNRESFKNFVEEERNAQLTDLKEGRIVEDELNPWLFGNMN